RVLVSPFVTHYADALHRQEHGEALPQPRVPPVAPDFFGHDRIGAAQNREALVVHIAENAHSKAWAWKRLADDEFFVEPQLAADRAHLVLEQLAQRFDERHPHPLRQSADVVMTLD